MVFAHEVGHNLGGQHVPGDETSNNPYRDYAFAHRFYVFPLTYSTIMANPVTEQWWDPFGLSIPIKHFSNPNVYFFGAATGIEDERDNARLINEHTGQLVEDYIDQVIPDNSIWVDTAYVGFEAGTFSQPYNSVQEGIDNVAPGGTIVFKEGSEDWTGTIDKAMTLTSGIGVMVIGR